MTSRQHSPRTEQRDLYSVKYPVFSGQLVDAELLAFIERCQVGVTSCIDDAFPSDSLARTSKPPLRNRRWR